jgi:3-oxoacyl-[acyl-carrier protein] reductase
VTGGSRGIGAAIARAFAERGDRVAVHCRDAVATAEVVRDSLGGDGHIVVRADLAVPAEVRAMVDAAAAGLDGLDVLVNNAGIYLEHPVLGTSYEEWQAAWQATLGVNLIGAANVTWCAVQHMTASGQRAGRIVNVGRAGRSGASRRTRPTGRARPGCRPSASRWRSRSRRTGSRWRRSRRGSWRPT